jgi:hypothetical protein
VYKKLSEFKDSLKTSYKEQKQCGCMTKKRPIKNMSGRTKLGPNVRRIFKKRFKERHILWRVVISHILKVISVRKVFLFLIKCCIGCRKEQCKNLRRTC